MRTPGGLFWKLLIALWLAMAASVAMTAQFLRWQGVIGPSDRPPVLNLLPVAPLVIGCVVMLLVSVGLAWHLSRPLNRVRTALHRLAEGRFDVRMGRELAWRRDEIADLALDFDRTAAELQRLTDARRLLLHDISHELRSPLTRLQAAIGLLRQDPSQTADMLGRIEREAMRMDALIEELLTLHRLEDAPGAWASARVDVLDLLHTVAADAAFEARAVERDVRIEAPGSFVSDVPGELLCRALDNVVRNAVKYTAPGTTVDIVAERTPATAVTGTAAGNGNGTGAGAEGAGAEGAEPAAGRPTDWLTITIADRGPGVAPELRARMFEPFMRLDEAAAVRGFGLGLAIARRALAVCGGTIEALGREGGGLTMRVRLPVR
ncbi:MAG: hypothetical protein RLY78_3098 [Pseudomonadota bacterium]|jgi:signal transduction histidine kinase